MYIDQKERPTKKLKSQFSHKGGPNLSRGTRIALTSIQYARPIDSLASSVDRFPLRPLVVAETARERRGVGPYFDFSQLFVPHVKPMGDVCTRHAPTPAGIDTKLTQSQIPPESQRPPKFQLSNPSHLRAPARQSVTEHRTETAQNRTAAKPHNWPLDGARVESIERPNNLTEAVAVAFGRIFFKFKTVMCLPSTHLCDNFCVPTPFYYYLKLAWNIFYVTMKRFDVDINRTYSDVLWIRVCDTVSNIP